MALGTSTGPFGTPHPFDNGSGGRCTTYYCYVFVQMGNQPTPMANLYISGALIRSVPYTGYIDFDQYLIIGCLDITTSAL
jgi:hypothetical protein